LIADGLPYQDISDWDVEHQILPKDHQDYGNTLRGIGALSAINMGYGPILFLDADTWYAEDHAEQAISCKMAQPEADVVASYRHMVLPDGTLVEPDQMDTDKQHIDTSCILLAALLVHHDKTTISHWGSRHACRDETTQSSDQLDRQKGLVLSD
jgi:hypothetical protein